MSSYERKRSKRADGQERDTATACREAHNEVGRFFQWTGSNDCHMANDWRQFATTAILGGKTADEAVQAIKGSWFEWCARCRIKPQTEAISPELFERYCEVRDMARSGLTPQHAAVMYRAIARDFPEAAATATVFAQQFDAMSDWVRLVAPHATLPW